MENPTQLQLLQAAVFFSAGIAVGVVYDVCRAVRRCSGRRAQWMADVLFVWSVGAGLFVLGMWAGNGQLRIFMLGSLIVGAVGYSLLCSGFVVPMLCRWFGFGKRLVRAAGRPFRRVKKFAKPRKNIFPKWIAWFKIIGYRDYNRHCIFRRTRKGETDDADEAHRMDGMQFDRSNGSVRSVEYRSHTPSADTGGGIPCGTAGGGSSTGADK